MNAVSAALMVTERLYRPIGAVRMTCRRKNNCKPTYQQCEEGQMNLIAGTLDAITMVEAAMKEVTEEGG